MIRPVTRDDLACMAALETRLFGRDAWDEPTLLAELEGTGRRFVVDSDDAGVRGYAVSRSIGDVVDLHRIGVAPERQREGLASTLLADLLAHPADADRMLLEVSAANHAATAFYARHGFRRIDVRPRYYRDGSDAWVMHRPVELAADRSGRMGR